MKKKKNKKKRKHTHLRRGRSQRQETYRAALKPELLAPAGTVQAFDAAISAGADAVYVGVGSLNARAFADNFRMEDLKVLTDYAHKQGRKIFVALNSIMKEAEIGATVETLAAAEEAGVDALIIQDLGIWRMAREFFPGLRLHASTLMTIHNSEGVHQAEKMGFSRVVLAREMTLREIRSVARSTSVELEVFIHGAMCFTYSGLCMFSSFHGGKSSTRGRCVQPCRRRYEWAGRKGTFFSMDDLNGLEQVHALAEMGITSLKIEGRLKPPAYVHEVVRAYRMVLDIPPDAMPEERDQVLNDARSILAMSLGRPGSRGYFLSPAPPDAVSPTRAAVSGQYIGKIISVSGNRAEVAGRVVPTPGDRLRIVDNSTDRQTAFTCRMVESRDDAVSGQGPASFFIDLPENFEASKGHLLFRTDMAKFRQKRPVPTWYESTAVPGKFTEIIRRTARSVLERIGKTRHEKRSNRSIDTGKTGNRPNTQRKRKGHRESDVSLWIKVRSFNQLKMALELRPSGVIMTISESNVRSITGRRGEMFQQMEVVWALPPIIQEERLGLYRRLLTTLARQGYLNFQVGNLAHLNMLKGINVKGARRIRVFGDYTLNIMNSQAIRAARDLGIAVPQLAVETDRENAELVLDSSPRPLFFTTYAWIPLFTSRLDHSSFAHGRPVHSSRDETFYWQRGNGAHVLIPDRPFSLFKQRHELVDMGFSALVADLSNWPAAKKIRQDRKRRQKLQDVISRGREFNFTKRLW